MAADSAAPDAAGGTGGHPSDAPLALDVGSAVDLPDSDARPSGTGGSGGLDAPVVVDASAGSGGAGSGGPRAVDAGLPGDGPQGGAGGGAGSGGLDSGGAGGLDGAGPGGANCSTLAVAATRLPTDVLLVLDRSGSMNNSIAEDCDCTASAGAPLACPDPATCTPRWPALVAAVNATMTSVPGISWGLKLFTSPGGSICTVSTGVEVPIAPSSASIIQAQIASVVPGNNTPTAAAITTATAYLKTVTDGHSKAILLATDGEPNCAGGSSTSSDFEGTMSAISAAKSAGFPVYVIGIGPSVDNLDAFAVAGGTNLYFPATSPEQLTAALQTASTAATGCDFTLPMQPPDSNSVGIYLDKSLVPRDSANGWSFGASTQTIVLAGSFCAAVTAGAASSLQALFACPGTSFPPMLP
jgi:hypothetical protein